MKEYFFLLSSITSAMKGEDILRKNGFRASVFRDSKINPYGCGYVIKVFGEKEKISRILQKAGIRVNEIRESR
ncbi:MAG: DUF3343 domain-containing protein [Oscillospiraceae bacterium]|nr:DUF3343 domain-containing protein [Oscillospiraceae bacterium]MBP1574596.1 DUF3343 domain-containing protein [Oscillospiraceae bacterium]